MSPHLHSLNFNQLEMVTGNVPQLSTFWGNIKDLEEWILHVDDNFIIKQTHNEVQRLAHIGLSLEEDTLEWWQSNKYRFNAWKEVKNAIREHYSNYYKLDRALNKISDLLQTGTVQKYLNDINRLNVYAKMTNYHLIKMILYNITPYLCQAMAHYKDLGSDPSKWKEKLVHVDFITSKFQKKEQDNRSKGQREEAWFAEVSTIDKSRK